MKKVLGRGAEGALFIRNVIFGVEDSLVSTVGLLAGIASTGEISRSVILLTGLVYISVEAFSMAIGSFLSEEFAEEYEKKTSAVLQPVIGATIMFVSFMVAGLIPVIPYMLLHREGAILWSIVASIIALFVLGMLGGRFSRTGALSRGVRMALLGGFAIGIGIVVGSFFSL